MGRGGGENRAIRLSAIPRRLKGAKAIGQRRYRLAHQRRDGSLGGEPGYIRSVRESSRSNWDSERIAVVEEVAVADKDGKLHWLDSDVIPVARYEHWASVGEARDLCDALNQKPLGTELVSEVDDQGRLIVKKVRRRYSGARGFLDIIEDVEQSGSFDVENPAEAQEAKKLYETLKAEVSGENEQAAAGLLEKLRSEGNSQARNLFPSQAVADRSRAAEQFSKALDDGRAEEVLEEKMVAEEEKEAEQEKKRSQRAKQTIDALSQT